MKKLRKFLWLTAILFAILVGLYPVSYWITDMSKGLLSEKSQELLASDLYNIAFYVHISTGGLALLIGWLQFLEKFRARKPQLHIAVGKIYMISVLLSGVTGFYIAFFATGGIVPMIGFETLSTLWLATTLMGYITVRKRGFEQHRNWMLRSYSLTFAAVMLRFWMGTIPAIFPIEPYEAYKLIAWLCWLPNLYVVELLIYNRLRKARKEIG